MSYTEITDTLKKPCKLRSEKELDALIPWFQALSKTFGEIEKDVLKSILKESTFVSVPKRVAVVVQGEVGDCVYMILKGTVSVFVQTAQENERILLPPEMAACSLDSKIIEGVYETEPLSANFNRTVFGNVFAEIGSGRIFGELAMMTNECIRKASVISEDASDFLVVKKDLYKQLMLEQHALELSEKREFLRYFPAFSEWSDRQVTNLALSLRMYQLKTGKDIVVQGKPFDGLHFIIKGQARISTDPNIHQRDFEKCFREKTEKNKKKPSLFKPRRGSEFSQAAKSFESETREPKPSLEQAADSISKHCPLNLCVMDAIGIVGDIEFMLGWNKYYSTVTCTEDCKILQLDKNDCAQLLTRSKRKTNYFLNLSRDKVSVLVKRWPGPCPVRLLMIALRELDKLLAPVPEARKESTGRRKQFMGDNNAPSLHALSFITNPETKEKTEKPEDSDSDDSVDMKNFVKSYRYSITLSKEKIKDKKKRKEAMFGRGKNASKTPTLSTKGLKKLSKRETDCLNESQQRELIVLEYRIHSWYVELENDLSIPADKCVPNLCIENTFTPEDICRLLDEYPAGTIQ